MFFSIQDPYEYNSPFRKNPSIHLDLNPLWIQTGRKIADHRLYFTDNKIPHIYKVNISMSIVKFYHHIMSWAWHMDHQQMTTFFDFHPVAIVYSDQLSLQ